jgi:hypothetical protein
MVIWPQGGDPYIQPTAQEEARIGLIESWGFQVTLIAGQASQADFDAAVADADVAYVSGEVDPGLVGTKLRNAAIGVVNEEIELALADKFGFTSAISHPASSTGELNIEDGTHYITSPFGAATITIFPGGQTIDVLGDPADRRAPGIQDLARMNSRVNLATLETGAALKDGGTAAGRRVMVPWGRDGFDFSGLTNDGQTIMQRSIEWAAGLDSGGAPECGEIYVNDIAMGWRKQGPKYFGQATVWIKSDAGSDVEGATVVVEWSGSVSGSSQGETGADGKVILESPSVNGGGTFICTVIDVVKDGCTYNASLNVETFDVITAP